VAQYFTVPADDLGVELDEYLCRLFPLARKRDLRALVRDGRVTVNGAASPPSQRLRADDVVGCDFDDEELEAHEPEAAPSEPPVLLHEDEHVLVVDKPADLLVEPDRWDESRPNLIVGLQVLSQLRVERGEEGFRPRLVHRLDKDTSGALAVAKTVDAERVLGAAFEQGGVV
jgi:23S rRNA pseudouridine1911/1915/1917 synthase